MPGAASSVSSHTTPLSSVRPEPSSHSVAGTTPTPTTTTSASTALPSARRTPLDPAVALDAGDTHAEAQVDAVVAVQLTAHRPELGPSPRTSGAGSASSTVTSSPRPRHVAATSAPMNPAPIDHDPRVAGEARAQRERVVEVRSTNMPSRSGVSGKRAASRRSR